jgi:hypothetical protein
MSPSTSSGHTGPRILHELVNVLAPALDNIRPRILQELVDVLAPALGILGQGFCRSL